MDCGYGAPPWAAVQRVKGTVSFSCEPLHLAARGAWLCGLQAPRSAGIRVPRFMPATVWPPGFNPCVRTNQLCTLGVGLDA